MKRVLSLIMAFVLVATFLVIPMEARAESSEASESRNGVVRIISISYELLQTRGFYSTGSGVAIGTEDEATDIFATNQHNLSIQHIEDNQIFEFPVDELYIALDNDWASSVPIFGGTADNVHAVRCEVLSHGPEDFMILRAARVIDERVALPLMLSHEAEPGDTIFALGYPGVSDVITEAVTADIDSMTVTRGTISRFAYYELRQANAIQIDADINHGNSGGPLITEEGFVIGLNSWGDGNADGTVNLAIEIDYVIDRLDQLIDNGTLEDFEYTLITERPDPAAETNILLWVAIGIGVLALISVFALKSSIAKIKQRTMSRRVTPAPAPAPAPAPRVENAPIAHSSLVSPTPQSGSSVTVFEDVSIKPSVSPAPAPVHTPAPSPSASFVVVGVKGTFAGKRFPVGREMRVGRNPGNDITYSSNVPGISGNHCTLSPRDNGVVLIDVGSTNGSYLPNGTRLNPNQKYLFKAGDMFCLGSKDQVFRVEPISGGIPVGAPTGSGSYTLVGAAGHFAGRRMALNKPIRIGRAPGCDILYPSNVPGISSNHCTLTPTAEGVVLMDQGSTYGSFRPDGTRLEPNRKYVLRKGESFCLGNASQRFTIE